MGCSGLAVQLFISPVINRRFKKDSTVVDLQYHQTKLLKETLISDGILLNYITNNKQITTNLPSLVYLSQRTH